MTMASPPRPNLDRRLRLAVAGAVMLTALTTGTAPATGSTAGSGASLVAPGGPRTQFPVFVLDKGRFSAFDAPELGAAEFQRINNRGQVVGSYSNGQGRGQGGYVRDRRGRITRFDLPGAASTTPLDNNDRGEIVGNYQIEVGGALRGFLRDRHGRFRTVQVPGSVSTQAYAINNRGQVVGDYTGADGVPHGYLWTRGRFITIDGPAGTGATLTDVNDRGQIIGLYADPGDPPGTLNGFLLRGGRYTTFDPDDNALTLPLGINDRGQIAGYTAARFDGTEEADAHGFVLRQGAGGPVTRVDVPGALGTGVMGINDRGQLVGVYINPNAAPSPPPAGMSPMGRMA
jgi:probable HAF family extracellular repeat protein